jgi:hypothetical protein
VSLSNTSDRLSTRGRAYLFGVFGAWMGGNSRLLVHRVEDMSIIMGAVTMLGFGGCWRCALFWSSGDCANTNRVNSAVRRLALPEQPQGHAPLPPAERRFRVRWAARRVCVALGYRWDPSSVCREVSVRPARSPSSFAVQACLCFGGVLVLWFISTLSERNYVQVFNARKVAAFR